MKVNKVNVDTHILVSDFGEATQDYGGLEHYNQEHLDITFAPALPNICAPCRL